MGGGGWDSESKMQHLWKNYWHCSKRNQFNAEAHATTFKRTGWVEQDWGKREKCTKTNETAKTLFNRSNCQGEDCCESRNPSQILRSHCTLHHREFGIFPSGGKAGNNFQGNLARVWPSEDSTTVTQTGSWSCRRGIKENQGWNYQCNHNSHVWHQFTLFHDWPMDISN